MDDFEQNGGRRSIDERKALRRECSVHTDLLTQDRAGLGVITNISPLGVFIKSLDVFRAGEGVKLVIKHREKVRRSGVIKWSNQFGFGLQFVPEQAPAKSDAAALAGRGSFHLNGETSTKPSPTSARPLK